MRVIDLANRVYDYEMHLTDRYLSLSDAGFSDSLERAQLAYDYSRLTFGRNHLEWISDGGTPERFFPSLFVRETPQRSPLTAALTETGAPHAAFRLGITDVMYQLFLGKYQALQKTSNGKGLMLHLRGLDCKTYITMDQAITAFRNNGGTHHCMTNAEYALRALKCRAQGFQPQGNNSYGKDEQGNYGTPVYIYESSGVRYIGRVAQGSGPLTWFDDGSPLGMWGLNGNAWEWSPGFRLVDGVIQILPYNTAALPAADLSAASTEWKSILADGSLVAPGTAGELKYGAAAADNTIVLSSPTWSGSDYFYGQFKNLDYTAYPAILKELSIIPCDTGDYAGDYIYINPTGERAACRPGDWYNGAQLGVSALNLGHPRSSSSNILTARGGFYRKAA